jgi:hypothetical protein
MKAGAAQVDITPPPGLELAGFAKRPQPSSGVLDPLFVRALYLEDGPERLLWLHADLLAFGAPLAARLRRDVGSDLAIPASRVLVTTTHTHSAPAVIALTGCGRVEPAYVGQLEDKCRRAARLAVKDGEPCRLVAAQGRCALGVDRRRSASAHTDPRVGALGWRRQDGSFKAAFLNYSMHPVSLRDSMMSADWPGAAARSLAEALPGRPVVLVTPGACGNINPPAVGVAPQQMSEWGQQVARSVVGALLATPADTAAANGASLRTIAATGAVPTENWDAEQVEEYAAACLADPAASHEFGDTFRLAVETWRAEMLDRLRRQEPPLAQAELGLITLGQTSLLTINGEMFSPFTVLAASAASGPVYTVSYANGMLGYIPSAEAYDEGAYEVTWAMLFYNLPRLRKGCLELLAKEARRLLAERPQKKLAAAL